MSALAASRRRSAVSTMPRRPTSADVATEAGVSRTTVSFVLNNRTDVKIPDETRQRVRSAAARIGYHPHGPARQLAAGRSHVIALVLRQRPEQIAADAVLVETLRGLASAARTGGFRVLVEPLPPDGPDSGIDSLLREQQVDGLIVSGPRLDDASLVALVEADDFPIVIQGAFPGLAVKSVDVDNVRGAERAVEHLLSLGHRRIACITNAPLIYTAANDRYDGYCQALLRAGLPFRAELVSEAAFDAPSGHRAMAELLGRASFDAVFVASDVVALGAIGALREAGRRVPDDVSLVGFDDIPLAAYFDPPLTTVRLPAFELGQAAGRALLERITHRAIPTRTLLPTELIVRGSTAPPASHRARAG
jgi:LacI family transcriptional regulator, galactose operon repressor